MMDRASRSPAAMAAICSNLAKACQKQMRSEESQLFAALETYFSSKRETDKTATLPALETLFREDLDTLIVQCEELATEACDRGTLRALTWGKKVTAIHKSLLSRHAKQQEGLLAGSNLYVCEACGYIAVAAATPEMCPICKAPASRFSRLG